ncbi:MAG: MFS transporter [Candidatus Omnitrophica bacterium]|nr:MFS transporter [Candidatus Omnitrophota bacterium]
MAKFTEVFKNRNFFLLWIGQIISQLGDRLDQMALIALVYSKAPGSAMSIAKILSFTIIPVFLVGPIAGVYVDRWDRRRIMYISDFLRAGLVLCIAVSLLNKNMGWVYLIIFIIFSIGRFFVQAKMAIIPDLVDKKQLLMANSLVNTTGMIAAVLGFGISGIVVEKLGAKAGFYLDSLSFLVSGACIFFIAKKAMSLASLKKVSQEVVDVLRKSVLEDIKDGLLYFFKEKKLRLTAGIIFALWAALGAVYVVIIVFIQQTLHSATKDLGLLIMFLGLGLFLGSLVYGRFGQKISHYKIIFICLILSGIMLIAFAFGIHRYPCFAVAAALSFLLGMVISPIMIATNTIIHKVSATHMMGKIFSSLEIVIHLGFLSFMFLSSLLVEKYNVSHLHVLVTVGIAIVLLGTINLAINNKITWLD